MSLNAAELASRMLKVFTGKLADDFPEIIEYAEAESKKLAETLVMIEKLKLAGKITEEQARLQLEIQKNATRAVLLAVEGLGLLAAEEAINSAFAVLKNAVNTALGFDLL